MAEFPIIPPESIKWTFGLGEWKPKAWGRTRTIFRDDQIEIVECEIKAGGFSSEHVHHRKHNEFRVIKGWLKVADDICPSHKVNIDSDPGCGVELLHDTMMAIINAGTRHQFLALEDTRLIEIYTSADGSPVDPDDIDRFTTGGIRQ